MTADLRARAAVLADLAQALGLSRPAGACFAAIWRRTPPPAAADLVATLGLSRSNVSTAVKELRDWGLVRVERHPGDRTGRLVAPEAVDDLARTILLARQRRIFDPLAARLALLDDAAGAEAAQVIAAIAARLAKATADPGAGKDRKKKRKKGKG